MSLFEKLPLDLKRLIALYLQFSFSFPPSLIEKYHNILDISDDGMIWRLIFERDYGLSPQLSEITDFKEEYMKVSNKTDEDRIQYAKDYSLEKLKIDNYLYQAVMMQNPDIEKIKYLISQGADVNIQSCDYRSTIHWASWGIINMKILIYLISQGANINTQDGDGNTPLHWISHNDCVEAAEYLVEKGANVNIRNKYGSPPLFQAIFSGEIRMIKCLIENGADLDIENLAGRTPLSYAISYDNREIVKYLVEHGADINYRDKNGGIPLYYAAICNRISIIKYLIERGADCDALSLEYRNILINLLKF